MKKYLILLLLLSFPSTHLWAGFKKGNGGNSVVCLDHTRLLDFYEAEILEGLEFEDDNRPWKTILEEKLDALAVASPEMALTYRRWLSEFDDQALYLTTATLGTINDSLHVIIPAGCTVEQTINQQMTPLPTEKRYWLVKKHWDNLSNFDKAGIVFHEFTYRRMQAADSREVRTITAKMFSTKH